MRRSDTVSSAVGMLSWRCLEKILVDMYSEGLIAKNEPYGRNLSSSQIFRTEFRPEESTFLSRKSGK